LGHGFDVFALGDELDAAELFAAPFELPLTAPAGMDLGFQHVLSAAELIEGFCGLAGRLHDDAARHRCAGRGQQFFGLVFVNLHA
jgi:hypothetical protein